MTCKDCIHHNVCPYNDNYDHHASSLCDHFKNKADVVEIVRCKDCKKRYTKNCSLCYDTANKGYFLWSMINDNFFCAYGERKCE